MPEQQYRPRPPAIPFDSDLARRAEAPRYGADRLVSNLAYHAGPEITVTAVVGGAGAMVVHPAALPVVATLTALYSAAARIHRRRETGPSRARTNTGADVETPVSTESVSQPVVAEGVA